MRPMPLLFLAALCMTGCGRNDHGTIVVVPPSKQPVAADPATMPERSDFSSDASAWYDEFQKDPAAAREKYRGKTLDLSGRVAYISPENWGVYLKAEHADPKKELGVPCIFPRESPWAYVSVGSAVKIRGKLFIEPEEHPPDGSVAPVQAILNPAWVMENKDVAVPQKATELAKQFTRDRVAFRQKFNDRSAYVEGEILEKASSQGCEILLRLKGDDGVTVDCCTGGLFNLRSKEKLKGARKGNTVIVYGTYSVFDDDDGRISLNMASVIELK